MINNAVNVSLYRGTSPPTDEQGEGRKIAGGPLYAEGTVATLVIQAKVTPWSRGAIKDAQKWSLDNRRIGTLIDQAIKHGRFLGSEWCMAKPGGPWAACDAYKVLVSEWNPILHKDQNITYYLKFALSKTGQLLLSASNHPEGT